MEAVKSGAFKMLVIFILVIIFSAAFAIFVHAVVPAPVAVENLDGVLVKLIGFPAVATGYFILLYIQCAIAIRYICKNNRTSYMQSGIRLGISFSLIYLVAMQEVFVEGSPFAEYGPEFIRYQFFMGLGDAIPAFILRIIVARFTIINHNNKTDLVKGLNKKERVYAISIITLSFITERTVAYETGIVASNCDTYTIPCYIWTALFGIVLGFIYTILYPLISNGRNAFLMPISFSLIIGLNWIIFNSFMGLILKNTMPQMLLRSGLDVMVLFIDSYIIEKIIIKKEQMFTLISKEKSDL